MGEFKINIEVELNAVSQYLQNVSCILKNEKIHDLNKVWIKFKILDDKFKVLKIYIIFLLVCRLLVFLLKF